MKKIRVSKNQIIFLSGATGLVALFLIIILPALGSRIKQPLNFNHKIHMENDMECLDCHLYYENHASSGKPGLEICSGCHEEPQGESRAEQKIVETVKSGKEIEWQRLYRAPEDVYFSHRRHVVLGKIDCKICHGEIGESSKPPSKPRKIRMRKCMACHEERDANNDCIGCHR